MNIKGKIEAIIYAAEEPVTVEQIAAVLKDTLDWRPDAQVEGDAGQLTDESAAIDGEASTESRADVQAITPATKPRKTDPLSSLKTEIRAAIEQLTTEYKASDRGMEIRAVAGGYRMATKPEHHDVVRGFAKNLKPPVRLSLAALETLAVVAYKQPITVPEVSEIRGVDAGGVIGTLLDRKLITTSGRKQVIGRPILYKTTREFLLRFALKDLSELPSMEEFEKLMSEAVQEELTPATPDPIESEPQPVAELAPAAAEAADEALSRSA
jgi:segregation and condensation protein B